MKRQRENEQEASKKKPVTFLGRPLNKLDIDEVTGFTPAGRTKEDYNAALALAIPSSKKSLKVWDQVAVDEKGRRRFHGAFTGGFSAGYFNTVDTEEGWKPSQFRSSLAERNRKDEQKVEDFMDEEDLENVDLNVSSSSYQFGNALHRKDDSSRLAAIRGGEEDEDDDFHDLLNSAGSSTRPEMDFGAVILRRMGHKEGRPMFLARLKRAPRQIGSSKRVLIGPQRESSSSSSSSSSGEVSKSNQKAEAQPSVEELEHEGKKRHSDCLARRTERRTLAMCCLLSLVWFT